MSRDTPDWKSAEHAQAFGDVISQNGRIGVRFSSDTIASRSSATIGFTHTDMSTIARVVGLRWLCDDDITFRAYLYNTLHGFGFYWINRQYEIYFPNTVNWCISKGDYVSTNVYNPDGSSHYFRFYVMIMEYPRPADWIPKPIASWTCDDMTPNVDQVVTFTDTSEYVPTSWFWTFGDGATSNDRNPTHAFTSPGSYKVSLVVGNDGGYTVCSYMVVVT